MPDDAIEEAWQQGRAIWSDIALDRERFADHVRALDADALKRFPGDLYLATACLEGNASALACFDREVLAEAHGAIRAVDARAEFVDEAIQSLRTSMFIGSGGPPRLAQYAGRGPLRAWVGIAAARTALMMRRSQQRAREVTVDDDTWPDVLVSISTNDPALEVLKRQYAVAFSAAFRDAVAALEPRLRAVLRMSFVDGLSIDEIGSVYAVHRATAARWIQRACDTLFEETRRLLVASLALSVTELDQMTALVRSQLDVSMSQLLPATIE